jgi:hypothetical protein
MIVSTVMVDDTPSYQVTVENVDTWSLNNTLAAIILPLLKKFKAESNAVPSDFVHGDDYDTGRAEWHSILDSMIEAFTFIEADDHEPDFEERPEVTKGLALFAKYFNHLWD